MRTIKHKIKIPIYLGYLHIIVTKDIKKVCKKYGFKKEVDKFDALNFSQVDKKKVMHYYHIQRPSVTYGAIAHEAKHIVNRIFRDRGIELDRYNDEAECYLLSWIVNQIHENINSKK